MKKNYAIVMLLCLCLVVVSSPALVIFAQDENVFGIDLITGGLEAVDVKNLTRVAVTDPSIADVTDVKSDKILILAKKPGQATVFLWDDQGKRSLTVRVSGEDLANLKQRVQAVVDKAEIKGVMVEEDPLEAKLVLSGSLSKADKAELEKIIDPYAANVMNLTKEEDSNEQVQIDMQITEMSATLDKNLGIDWQTHALGSPVGLDYVETLPQLNGAKDWFKVGQFNRTTNIASTINLMINEGKARDLSRPRLMVSSGKEATINVGGEIPISTITFSSVAGSTATQNITYKKYGLTLTVTPTVRGNKIDIVMNVEITDIDKTFPVPATSTNGIAFKTRSAQTYLMMDNQQTVVFAGMIRYNDSEQVRRVPFLGKLPVVGALFRNNSKPAPDEGKELVITLTPTIMRKKEYAVDQMKFPTSTAQVFEKEVEKIQGYAREPLGPRDLPKVPAEVVPPSASRKSPMVITGAAEITDPVYTGVTKYVRDVQMKISRSIIYPDEAVKKNWQGTVKLKLHIAQDGSLIEAAVAATSGHDIFDKGALNTAKTMAPFAAFPSEMTGQDLVVTVPIVYSQGAAAR